MTAGSIALSLSVMVLFLVLNAFFVATEFALVSSRRSRIQELVDGGNSTARIVAQLQQDMGTSVSGTQLGITLCSLALGWFGEDGFEKLVNWTLSAIPGVGTVDLPHGVGVFISFVLLSATHVVLGEQVPKFVSLRLPERLILITAPIFRIYCKLAWPLIWLLNRCAELILKALRVPKPDADHHFVHSAEELEMLFEASRRAGELGDRETDLLKNVLDLRDLTMDQVLLPVSKMDAVAAKTPLADLLAVVAKTKHSKLPVYIGSVNNIVGILNTRDLFDWWSKVMQLANTNGELWKKQVQEFSIQKLLRPAYQVLNTDRASSLLDELRKRKIQIAIVKDTNGKTVGLVTMEDLLEELVGEIYDEYDK